MEKDIRKAKKRIAKLYLIIFAIFGIIYYALYFRHTHFFYGTEIEGVNCSFLTIEEARERIRKEKGKEIITLCFSSGRSYDIPLSQMGLDIYETKIEEIFEHQHSNPKESRKYHLENFFTVSRNDLKTIFFEGIPELRKENMVEPKDACIAWTGYEFVIQEEVYGSIIDPEEALEYALKKIVKEEKVVNFTLITDIYPEIYSQDLESERDELNTLLNSSITFELSNGNTVTLDSNTIKNWIYIDENNKFKFDVENGVNQFIEYLSEKVNEANSSFEFTPTDFDEAIAIDVESGTMPRLNKEEQFDEIVEMLGNPEPINVKPHYDRIILSDLIKTYIEIDITRQHIWFYIDGELYAETDCVTGNVSQGYGTPTGVFYLLNKDLDVMLEGYNKDGTPYSSHVDYWMRFYMGVGLHDASWRGKFGGNIYKTGGSHGCVNLPPKIAPIFYEAINETIPIVVYESVPV